MKQKHQDEECTKTDLPYAKGLESLDTQECNDTKAVCPFSFGACAFAVSFNFY